MFYKKKILSWWAHIQYYLHGTQTMEMEQNETFFHGAYSNLTSSFTGHKMLKYFNDFYNWHHLIYFSSKVRANK